MELRLDPSLSFLYSNRSPQARTVRERRGPRTVHWFELDFILWGEGAMITDGVYEPTVEGTLFFRWPGVQVEWAMPYQCYYMGFWPFGPLPVKSGFELDTPLEPPPDWQRVLPLPPVMHIRDVPGLASLFGELYEEQYRRRPMSDLAVRTLLMRILLRVLEEQQDPATGPRPAASREAPDPDLPRRRIRLVTDRLDTAPEISWTLDGMARLAGYSRYAFCRLFTRLVGESPFAYLNRCRIDRARRILAETGLPVARIPEACGFPTASYFFRTFRRQTGMTPAEYRKRNTVHSGWG